MFYVSEPAIRQLLCYQVRGAALDDLQLVGVLSATPPTCRNVGITHRRGRGHASRTRADKVNGPTVINPQACRRHLLTYIHEVALSFGKRTLVRFAFPDMGESTKLCYESWLVEPAGPSQLDQTTELLDGFSDSQQLGQYMLAGSQSSCAESNIFQANIGPPSGYERASNSWSLLDSYRVTTSGQSIVSPADTILSPSCRPESLQDCPMMLPDCQNDSSTISSDCHHQSILMNGMRPTDESAEIREIHTASGNVNTIATRKPVRLTRTRKPPVDQFPRRGRVAKASRRSRIGQREEIQDCITVSTDATAATDDTKISEASAAALNASSPVTMTTMSDEASIMSLEEHVISPVQPERPHLSHPPEVTKEAAIFSSISDDAHSSSDLLSGIVEAMSRQWSPLNESSAARTGQAEDQSTPAAQAGTNAAATHSRTLNSTCDVTPTMTGAFRVRLMAVFEADASVLCVSASDAFSFNRSVRPGYEGLSWNETATVSPYRRASSSS